MARIKQNKPRTLEQYIEYRNTLITRRDARHRNFPDKETYYDIRIEEIDNQYPEFKKFAHIKLKGKTNDKIKKN